VAAVHAAALPLAPSLAAAPQLSLLLPRMVVWVRPQLALSWTRHPVTGRVTPWLLLLQSQPWAAAALQPQSAAQERTAAAAGHPTG
jgi:hypothetical protein